MKVCNAIALVVVISGVVGVSYAEQPDTERQQELRHLLKHDCGACHGMRLTGGLGPALTSEVLREKPDELLRQTILHGRRGTPMPPFANLLSAEEIEWLIRDLRKGINNNE
jgi:cytochrome c55X